MSRENPTTDVSGVRSSWLTLERNALHRRALFRRGPGRLSLLDRDGESGRALRDPMLERVLLGLDLGVEPGVVDGRRHEAPNRIQERSVTRSDVAAGRPVVDREDAHRPALGDQRRPDEGGHLHQLGKHAVAFIRIVVDVAEHQRAIGVEELHQVRRHQVEGQLELRHRGRHLGGPADGATARQDPRLVVCEEHERAIEPQVSDHGLE